MVLLAVAKGNQCDKQPRGLRNEFGRSPVMTILLTMTETVTVRDPSTSRVDLKARTITEVMKKATSPPTRPSITVNRTLVRFTSSFNYIIKYEVELFVYFVDSDDKKKKKGKKQKKPVKKRAGIYFIFSQIFMDGNKSNAILIRIRRSSKQCNGSQSSTIERRR